MKVHTSQNMERYCDHRTFILIAIISLFLIGTVGYASAEFNANQNHPPVIEVPGQEDYQYLMKWGSQGTGPSQFYYPRMAAVDGDGYIYVTDCWNNRTQKFDLNGNFIGHWGTGGNGPGQFNAPDGIIVNNVGSIFIVDRANNRIQKFDTQGNFIKQWGTKGSENGQFINPLGIASDSAGNLYVSDLSNHRIQKFDSDGNFILKWGGYGTGDGQFNRPLGIAVDANDYVYVVEPYNLRVQKFDSNGKFILKWGSGGTGDGQFSSPFGVAADKKDYIYVSDLNRGIIQIFSAEGNFVTKIGSPGIGISQFSYPTGIVFDAQTNLYVVEQTNNRVQKFIPTVQVTVPEQQTLNLHITGTDLDGEALTFGAQNLPQGATFDPVTADFTWTPIYGQAGIYSGIIFTVSDGQLIDSRELIVNVTQVKRAPVLGVIGNKMVDEGQQLTFTISAMDADSDVLTYDATGVPGWATFDAATQTFSGTPDFTQSGTYQVTFTVSDGSAADSEVINITVNDVPQIQIPLASFTATPTSGTTPLTVTFTDTSTNAPTSWIWSFGDGDTTDSTIQNPIHRYSNIGTYTVSMRVTNAAGSNTIIQSNYIIVTAASPGSIYVTSVPAAARIFINSIDTGYITPYAFTKKAEGSYTVYVNKNGYLTPTPQTKPVTSSQETQFTFTLTPDPDWYTFIGFDAPVDMIPIINTANSGKNIPLKWQLSDRNGYVSDPSKFVLKIDSVACGAGTFDPIEVYDSTTTTSGLNYQGNGIWHYNWKTEKAFAGKCMNVYLKYDNDLTSPIAKFQFK
jgi:tripartite motif-containing protein 71